MLRRTRNGTGNKTGHPQRKLGRLCSCGGFTMVELIIIIVMVGILATVAAMKYGSVAASANLRTAVDQIAGDLRFLQTRAMASLYSTGPIINVATFPVGANTYNLGGQVKALPSGVIIQNGLTVTFNSLGEYNTTTDAVFMLNSRGSIGTIKIYAISGDVEGY